MTVACYLCTLPVPSEPHQRRSGNACSEEPRIQWAMFPSTTTVAVLLLSGLRLARLCVWSKCTWIIYLCQWCGSNTCPCLTSPPLKICLAHPTLSSATPPSQPPCSCCSPLSVVAAASHCLIPRPCVQLFACHTVCLFVCLFSIQIPEKKMTASWRGLSKPD